MATGYNLRHMQVAQGVLEGEPEWIDIPIAISAEIGVDQDTDSLRGDGSIQVNTVGAREGTGSIGFGSSNLPAVATITGDEITTYDTLETGGYEVSRLEVKGGTVVPALQLAVWVPNVDGRLASAGIMQVVPNATITVPSASFDQESFTEWEADLSFAPDNDDVMMIWELHEETPAMDDGVMPVFLEVPDYTP